MNPSTNNLGSVKVLTVNTVLHELHYKWVILAEGEERQMIATYSIDKIVCQNSTSRFSLYVCIKGLRCWSDTVFCMKLNPNIFQLDGVKFGELRN